MGICATIIHVDNSQTRFEEITTSLSNIRAEIHGRLLIVDHSSNVQTGERCAQCVAVAIYLSSSCFSRRDIPRMIDATFFVSYIILYP